MTKPKAERDDDGPVRSWVFTFGHGQVHFGKFVQIRGTNKFAREEMHRRFGTKWSMQYSNKKFAGVERFGLQEIH